MQGTAIAQPNIALIKYWGKRDIERNLPAVGSISITLRDLYTRMHVELDGALGLDTVITGSWDGTSVQIRSVVMRRKGCLYDLLYVSPTNAFGSRSADFDRFVNSWQFLSEQP